MELFNGYSGKVLEKEFRRQQPKTIRCYRKMTDRQQLRVIELFRRHYKACVNSDCLVDPEFLLGAIEEVAAGREG